MGSTFWQSRGRPDQLSLAKFRCKYCECTVLRILWSSFAELVVNNRGENIWAVFRRRDNEARYQMYV